VSGAGSIADRPCFAQNVGTIHGRFFVVPEARTDRQMLPRDCSAPPCSAVDQRNSAGLPRLGRCNSTPVANITGSLLWQEPDPATPTDIESASIPTACAF